jgi:hypothetical protein
MINIWILSCFRTIYDMYLERHKSLSKIIVTGIQVKRLCPDMTATRVWGEKIEGNSGKKQWN